MDLFPVYTGSGWVDCLCELCFGFVTKTAGNTLAFWLLLSITGTVLRLPRSPWCVGWGGQEAGRGFGLGQLLPVDCKDILCCITSCSAKKSWGDWWVGWQVPVTWDCWASVCLWELVSGGKHYFVVFQFPLCWINCVYLDPHISLLFLFSPMPHHCGSKISKISICCLGLSHYRVHNHSNISFFISSDVILNMIPEETTRRL